MNLNFYNTDNIKKIYRNWYAKFAHCIHSTLSNFDIGTITKNMKRDNARVLWCTTLDKLNDKYIIKINGINETLVSVIIIQKCFIKKHLFGFIDIILFSVYEDFQMNGVGTKMIKYLTKCYPHILIVVHPDCISFNFYLSNFFLLSQSFEVKLKDFVLYIFMNKNPKYNELLKIIKERMFKSCNNCLELGIHISGYSSVLLYHTYFNTFEKIYEYYRYYLNNISIQKWKSYVLSDIPIDYIPSHLKGSNLNELKLKLLGTFNSVYFNLTLIETKKNIIKEIITYLGYYDQTKQKLKSIRFEFYIYINVLISLYNKFSYCDKLFYFIRDEFMSCFDNGRKEILYGVNSIKDVINNISNLIKMGKCGFKLKMKQNLINYLKFYDFFKSLHSEESFRYQIFTLFNVYKKGENKIPERNIKTPFDLYLFINRMIYLYNSTFKKKENYFVYQKKKKVYKNKIKDTIKRIENIDKSKVKFDLLIYKDFLMGIHNKQ